jgi:hypothetical protein
MLLMSRQSPGVFRNFYVFLRLQAVTFQGEHGAHRHRPSSQVVWCHIARRHLPGSGLQKIGLVHRAVLGMGF